MSKEIILCKKGSITKWQKEKLSKSGFIVLDVENPDDVKIHREQELLPVWDMMMSALKACDRWTTADSFVKELYARLSNKESLNQPKT